MTTEATDENLEPTSDERTTVPQTVGSFLISIAFWSTLLVSAVMYAAVSLSPKLADWISVREQHAANTRRLQELEDEADYLERVAAALKSDPEFAHRLVNATQSGNIQNEFVPVSNNMAFGGTRTKASPPKPLVQPAVADIVKQIASDQKYRTWLLCGAAGLTVFAFTLLNDAGAGIMQTAFSLVQDISRSVFARYRRDPPESSSEETENRFIDK